MDRDPRYFTRLADRLTGDPAAELRAMLASQKSGTAPMFFADLDAEFQVAKERPREFRDHGPVLGIAIGGTNAKAIVAALDSGELTIEHIVKIKDPAKATHWHDFFDQLLTRSPAIKELLRTPGVPIGFSFPMAVIDGIPFHATKIPTIEGLVTREPAELATAEPFGTRFAQYLVSRGYPAHPVHYQGDGIVAHHGAVTLYAPESGDSTMLLICGTGLATGDERHYYQIGIEPLLAPDEELFPIEETEQRQLQYALAGKGLFGVMRRTLTILRQDGYLTLSEPEIVRLFADSDDSVKVMQLFMSTLPEAVGDGAWGIPPLAQEVYRMVPEEDRPLVAWAAQTVMRRAVDSLANCIIATIVGMGRAPSGTGHHVFFEGGIATNPAMLPRIQDAVMRRIHELDIYTEAGVQAPLPPNLHAKLRPWIIAEECADAADDIDISVVGAATLAAAGSLTT